MAIVRKVTKIGDSLWVSLPKSWAYLHNIRQGSKVELVAVEDGLLIKIKKT